MSSSNEALQVSVWSILSNLGLASIKFITGFLGNSYALIADAIESTSDVFASFLVWLGIKYSERPADDNHPYGHGKAESLITFLVVGFLVLSSVLIAYQAIVNINTPHELPKGFTLYVLGAIIIWKELSYRYVNVKSKKTRSSSLKADAWHHRSDAITSMAAFIGITIALIMGEGWSSADDWAALVASVFILINAYFIFRPALGEVMDEHLNDQLIIDIREISVDVEGVMGTEKCIVRKSGMQFHIDLHALVDGQITVEEGHKIAHRLIDRLKKEIPYLGWINIHIEPFSAKHAPLEKN